MDRLTILREAFSEHFGGVPEIVTTAPGRINLIGEHTDYNDGFVFPMAIDRGLLVAARIVDEPTELVSVQIGKAHSFDAMKVEIGGLTDWARYPAAMAWVLREHGEVPNIQAVVHSDIPIGSGVSSSAAIQMAFGVLYRQICRFDLDSKSLAVLAQKAENEFVGMRSGIMDQMASAMGRKDKAMYLDTRSLDIAYADIPPGLSILLCDTCTPRALTSSAYNECRSQCEEASRALGVKALRDASITNLETHRTRMDEVVYRRAKHVITENERCGKFRDALNTNQRQILGDLMKASHISLRDDYEVSSPELDMMAEACWAAPGCVGARMTGAGFGGACVAIVETLRVPTFEESVNSAYKKASGIQGDVFSCHAVDGAAVIEEGMGQSTSSENHQI